ncbi:MAG: hypothetical protein H6811_01040 [Phycisphaeraceae bacterium]|nr:hypothetical protein [Phycisphaeraceae bacterium]
MRAVLLTAMLILSGCVEKRVVKWDPPLAGLPGAQTSGPIVGQRFDFADPRVAPPEGLRVEHEDGSITLNARSGRHLLAHIVTTLDHDERALFTGQVLSSLTRAEYSARGQDPGGAFDLLKGQYADVMALARLMPMGEFTPGVIWKKLGRVGPREENLVRLLVTGPGTSAMRYNGLDMVMEGGNWRLRWFAHE